MVTNPFLLALVMLLILHPKILSITANLSDTDRSNIQVFKRMQYPVYYGLEVLRLIWIHISMLLPRGNLDGGIWPDRHRPYSHIAPAATSLSGCLQLIWLQCVVTTPVSTSGAPRFSSDAATIFSPSSVRVFCGVMSMGFFVVSQRLLR